MQNPKISADNTCTFCMLQLVRLLQTNRKTELGAFGGPSLEFDGSSRLTVWCNEPISDITQSCEVWTALRRPYTFLLFISFLNHFPLSAVFRCVRPSACSNSGKEKYNILIMQESPHASSDQKKRFVGPGERTETKEPVSPFALCRKSVMWGQRAPWALVW